LDRRAKRRKSKRMRRGTTNRRMKTTANTTMERMTGEKTRNNKAANKTTREGPGRRSGGTYRSRFKG
jgi:hypothetical protein